LCKVIYESSICTYIIETNSGDFEKYRIIMEMLMERTGVLNRRKT
jgi:hypothetical protein